MYRAGLRLAATAAGALAALAPAHALAEDSDYPLSTVASYPGIAAYDVRAALVDADEHLDLVAKGELAGQRALFVMRGRGDGTFRPPDVIRSDIGHGVAFALEIRESPLGPAAGDIVLKHLADGELERLRKVGGSYVPGPTSSAGEFSFDLAMADFNGDERLDIAGHSRAGLGVQLGNADGSFAQPASIAVTLPPWDEDDGDVEIKTMDAGDLDVDGDVDLILSTGREVTGKGPIVTMLGNGQGAFSQASTDYPGAQIEGGSTRDFTIADLSGDAIPDLVMTATGGFQDHTSVLVALGRGDGLFHPPAIVAQGGAFPAALGDFDGDASTDIVSYNDPKGAVAFVPGTGDGTFGPPIYDAGDESMWGVGEIAAGDFDHDGQPDIAFSAGMPEKEQTFVQLNRDIPLDVRIRRLEPARVGVLARRGATVRLRSDVGCGARVAISLEEGVARRLRLDSRTVARGGGYLPSGRIKPIDLSLNERAARKLRRSARDRFALRVRATCQAGKLRGTDRRTKRISRGR